MSNEAPACGRLTSLRTMWKWGKRMMRVTIRLVFLTVCLGTGLRALAHGQAPALDGPSRRDQLAKTLEMMSDPDPLQRMANMESIVASHDALRIEVAIKAAMASDDAQIRGMAMTAYMASVKKLDFQIRMPPAVQRQYDSANGDETEQQAVSDHHDYISNLKGSMFQMFLDVVSFQMNDNHGTATLNRGREDPFSITGDRYLQDTSQWGHRCIVEFRPTRKISLAGTLSCERYPPFEITAQMF